MPRHKTELDIKQFENLCGLQCTKDEMCSFFEITDKTLERWCIRTYQKGFSEVFREKRGKGKIALRRSQFRLAEKNANMAIWLGKQYLGQTDSGKVDIRVVKEDDPITAALKEECFDGAFNETERNT